MNNDFLSFFLLSFFLLSFLDPLQHSLVTLYVSGSPNFVFPSEATRMFFQMKKTDDFMKNKSVLFQNQKTISFLKTHVVDKKKHTGWRKSIGCLKLQVSFRKRKGSLCIFATL